MSLVLGLRHVLRSLVRRAAVDAETREELAFHLERQTAKHVAAGMTPADAARLARLELGGAERWREATADARRGRLLHDGLADARYALRGFAARPGFALAAIATVAIGVAAGTALFAVVDGALLRPLPFRDPGRIMSLALRMPVRPSRAASVRDAFQGKAEGRARRTTRSRRNCNRPRPSRCACPRHPTRSCSATRMT